MKRAMLFVPALAVFLLTLGCGGGLKAGDEVVAELSRDQEIGDLADDAEASFLEAGRPVQESFPCASHALRAGKSLVIEAESDDFDPVLAIVDKEGALITVCDDWSGSTGARVVAADIPGGARLLVFGVDGERGEYELTVSEAEDKDMEEYLAATVLSEGTLEGEKCGDKEDDLMDELLSDALEDYSWLGTYAGASVIPFEVTEDGLCSISLVSDDFDPILAVVAVDGDEYDYVGYNDDFGGELYSRIDLVLEPGSYEAVVLSYDEEGEGSFELSMHRYPAEALTPSIVDAGAPGTLYTGEIAEGANLAAGIWETISTDRPYEVLTSAASPCAFFEFTISQAEVGLYDVEAASEDLDAYLTLVRRDDGTVTWVASNDDASGGTDSRITRVLPEGSYVAMVSTYDDTGSGSVEFSYQPSTVSMIPLVAGRPVDGEISYEAPQLAYTFEAMAGRAYTITATSLDIEGSLDPYIEAIMPDGSQLTDDDGAGYPNSRLVVDAIGEQTGRVILIVRDLSNSGTGRVRVEMSEERSTQAEVFATFD